MTLRELAKGYDGDVLIKAYENEKSKIPTAIMQSSVTDAIRMRYWIERFTVMQWSISRCSHQI